MVPLFRSKRFVAGIIANVEAIDYPNVEIILSVLWPNNTGPSTVF